jgi:ATP-dependent Clp protease adapter protein ClpS
VDPLSLMVLAGVGGVAWMLRRSHARYVRQLAAASDFDDDVDVALHVATHEARQRRHPWLTSVHLLYGLLQDDTVVAAIRASGGDPDRLEDRVLAALDGQRPSLTAAEEAGTMLSYARITAQHGGRRPGRTDVWAALRSGSDVVALCAAAGIDRDAVLFRLFHGDEPAAGERLGGELDVVLRNDHYTTKAFVCELLEEVFALDPAAAAVRMEATHTAGHAVVGRYRAAEARAKVAEARQRAKAQGFPLWIGVEPA